MRMEYPRVGFTDRGTGLGLLTSYVNSPLVSETFLVFSEGHLRRSGMMPEVGGPNQAFQDAILGDCFFKR